MASSPRLCRCTAGTTGPGTATGGQWRQMWYRAGVGAGVGRCSVETGGVDMSWSRFSNLFILNKVLRMTICAKCSYIFEPKRYQNILTRFV